MQKVQFSNDYHQIQDNALVWNSWKFDRAPTEYYFYPEINTCKPSRFQDKIQAMLQFLTS